MGSYFSKTNSMRRRGKKPMTPRHAAVSTFVDFDKIQYPPQKPQQQQYTLNADDDLTIEIIDKIVEKMRVSQSSAFP